MEGTYLKVWIPWLVSHSCCVACESRFSRLLAHKLNTNACAVRVNPAQLFIIRVCQGKVVF